MDRGPNSVRELGLSCRHAPAAGALEADLVVAVRLIDVIMAEDMTVAYYAAGAEHPASTPGSMELVPCTSEDSELRGVRGNLTPFGQRSHRSRECDLHLSVHPFQPSFVVHPLAGDLQATAQDLPGGEVAEPPSP